MQKGDIYVFVDKNSKSYDNELSVNFTFPSDVKPEDAVKQIDELVSLADNRDDIEFTEHRAIIYSLSPLTEPDEDLYT